MSEENSNKIDFSKITAQNISEINLSDKKIHEALGIESIPDFDNLSYDECKNLSIKYILLIRLYQRFHAEVMQKMISLSDKNREKDDDDNSESSSISENNDTAKIF